MCLYCAPDHLVLICVLHIEVCVIDKMLCEYEPNQATDYAINVGLIMSKTPVNNACIKLIVVDYMYQQQPTGHVANG